jgi:hypothetical protein
MRPGCPIQRVGFMVTGVGGSRNFAVSRNGAKVIDDATSRGRSRSGWFRRLGERHPDRSLYRLTRHGG